MRRAPRSRDPTRLLKCAQLWSCSSIVSAFELCVDHVEGVEHDSTIRLMVEARLGTLNGRVQVKYYEVVDLKAVFECLGRKIRL